MQQRNHEARTGSFGDLLRQYRIDSGLTQEELAERTGLSVRGISDLERGVRQEPYRHTVQRLAEVLQLGESQRAALDAARHPTSPAIQQQSPATLPVPLTSFIGRERELEEVRRLLSTRRLLSLVGTGGVGKTRLAVEAARMPLEESPVFVDLAPLSDARLVPATIAAVLGVRDQPAVPALVALTAAIAPRSLLLILDNCEHLVQACAELVAHLLRGCPGLRILVTSREPLGVDGEQRWHVFPLTLPGPSNSDAAVASEAVQLFVERSRLVQPVFELDDDNVVAVAEICRRLDGIPLAIELAAAQMTVLSPHQLAQRLEDRFRLLTLGSRTASARQQTLHAVIDWSHHLLTDAEQSLFRRVGVFAGGWTLEMAEQICGGDGLGREQIFDLLARLVEKSMVQVSQKDAEARYSFLETLRQYAAERLTSAAEDGLVREAHLQWCVALAERADAEKDGPQRAAWFVDRHEH